MMSLVPMPARLKLLQACDHWHSSRVFTPRTGWHCKLRPNTEGLRAVLVALGKADEDLCDLILEQFDNLDTTKDGLLSVDDFKGAFDSTSAVDVSAVSISRSHKRRHNSLSLSLSLSRDPPPPPRPCYHVPACVLYIANVRVVCSLVDLLFMQKKERAERAKAQQMLLKQKGKAYLKATANDRAKNGRLGAGKLN
jgi:hypothetical protein